MSPGIMGLRWFRRKSKAKFRCSLCGKTAGVVELLPRAAAQVPTNPGARFTTAPECTQLAGKFLGEELHGGH
jgi:hypothetical protein